MVDRTGGNDVPFWLLLMSFDMAGIYLHGQPIARAVGVGEQQQRDVAIAECFGIFVIPIAISIIVSIFPSLLLLFIFFSLRWTYTKAPGRVAVYAVGSTKKEICRRCRPSGKIAVSATQWWCNTMLMSSTFVTGFLAVEASKW